VPPPLYHDPRLTLIHDQANGVVRYIRSREPFGTAEEIRELHQKIVKLMPESVTAGLGLLLDVRDAPPRNDEAFEAAAMQALALVLPRFAAHAALVKSAVGRLQTQRLSRQRGGDTPVFSSEAEALAYLAAATRRRPAPG
jgi:hypothetical protein